MDIKLRPEGEAWRRRGRTKTAVPQFIIDALMATYDTGEVGVIPIRSPDDKRDAMEFVTLARRACRQAGQYRVLFQPKPHTATTELRFRVVERIDP